MKQIEKKAIFFAIFAALLYSLNAPISKLLLDNIPPTMMAGFLYLGAGIGLSCIGITKKIVSKKEKNSSLTIKELPFTIGMIVLDIAAPIFLMFGLTKTTSANASLLNNFEIVSTSLIALLIFHEKISKRLWCSITLVTLSSILLSIEDMSSFSFSIGSLFVLAACVCWGIENNFTRVLSSKNPLQIVILKGFFSGFGSLLIALIIGERYSNIFNITISLLLGFIAYGLSIYFYILAQRWLGATKTSAYYAISPFIGVFLSWIILGETPSLSFIIAFLIMIIGTYLISSESPK